MRCSLAFCVFEACSMLKWKGWSSSWCSYLAVCYLTYKIHRNLCTGWMESTEGCSLQLHPHLGSISKLHVKRDLGCSEGAGTMERCPVGILGRSLSSASGGTEESVGQLIFPPCWSLQGCWLQCPAPLLPQTPSPQLGGEHSLGRVGCCNEVTVSVFKECFIHYILEMYRKWSKN